MAKSYNININNGSGSANVFDGTYSVSSNTTGYLNNSISPSSVNIVDGINEYVFTIGAEGILTLHVTDTGLDTGNPIVGAKFKRCDSNNVEYGDEITTDEQGNAVFQYVPFDSASTILIYYKQIASDSEHTFDSTLKNISLDSSTKTLEVANPLPVLRTFKLNDANYSGLPISVGSITLS